MDNQQPPQLPPQAPQPRYQVPQPQYQQPNQLNQPAKKRMPTWAKILIGIGAGITFCVVLSMFFDENKGTGSSNTIDQKWKDKAIKDSTRLANGYFAASAMSDFDTFIKRYHELELMAVQQHPKEVTDSALITMGNRNANNAMAMITDSMTVYRNMYTKILKDKLWLDNITVRAENGGKNLWFIGGTFASNRNIAEFHDGMKPMFKSLGYKRIYYKWVDVSSAEYTYFDLDK